MCSCHIAYAQHINARPRPAHAGVRALRFTPIGFPRPNRCAGANPRTTQRRRRITHAGRGGGTLRRYGDAEVLLRRCGQTGASFMPAPQNLAWFYNVRKGPEALAEIDIACRRAPGDRLPQYQGPRSYGAIGEYEASLQLYERCWNNIQDQAKVWIAMATR